MPAIVRAQVIFQRATFLPEDVIVNTFHFVTAGDVPTPTELADIATALDEFYDLNTTSGAAVRAYFSAAVAATGHRIKMYNLLDPEPRVPIYNEPLAITAPAGAPLPAEVAICLSYQGTPVSGVPQARKRGRVYVGPLSTGALLTGTDDAYPASVLTATLVAAGLRLINDVDVTWGVWSPTGLLFTPATSVWVDNAFDVQRRRGHAPTGRTSAP